MPAIPAAAINAGIYVLGTLIYRSGVFERLIGVVQRQEEKAKADAAHATNKRDAAIAEAKTIGLELAGWILNLGIELAVGYINTMPTKDIPKPVTDALASTAKPA